MRNITSMQLRFNGSNDDTIDIEIHPHLIQVAHIKGAVADAWRDALKVSLKREPTSKDIGKSIGKVRIKTYHSHDKLPEVLLVGSEIKLYLSDRLGQAEFWRGVVSSIDKVRVTTTH